MVLPLHAHAAGMASGALAGLGQLRASAAAPGLGGAVHLMRGFLGMRKSLQEMLSLSGKGLLANHVDPEATGMLDRSNIYVYQHDTLNCARSIFVALGRSLCWCC